MPRSSRRELTRTGYRDRHGRGIRSAVTGPHLPMLHSRFSFFDACVGSGIEYLRSLWPEELASVRVEIGTTPPGDPGAAGVERWRVDRRARRVVLYRVPIERMAHLHRDDDWHRRSYIESCVFRAVAELLGRDPWEIAPERYRHF
ncbi:metallopeptidase family protein [Homoserinibacter sp. GY 40078]|uniref:metallopeptidase family protein n=1 Tax=Homoserinibacter sp. GY 40078 TaxID=2603275 RepID=UPI0011CB06C8|nr:metallopeptidase family protein [Homoserinibacter sp. GY 40078]TXK16277.1 metallopeptidase family protein [Homoserinibacter sp. GY 40078]